MSPHRLEQGPTTNDPDARIANLEISFKADLDNQDRGTVLWLLANWRHARDALRVLGELYDAGTTEAELARAGLEVVGE